jgi:TerC family integral membrane protein
MRGAFIAAGAALIGQFSWVFYIFGAFLVYTAITLIRHGESDEDDFKENVLIRWAKRALPVSSSFDSGHMTVVTTTGRRLFTPMLIVMIAIGTTDLIFALDSIPAIFGLTQNVYIVFTATAFSLLGLRQLYFLIDGLLDRLVYLSYGLAAILALIGVKLVLHAMRANNVPFINDGEPIEVVEISTGLSLAIIVAVLSVTVVVSLLSPKGRAQTYVTAARRHAREFLDVETDPAYCDEIFHRLLNEEAHLRRLPEKYRARIRAEEELMRLLREAHEVHDQRVADGRCFVPSIR